ncbi:MAG: signal peptidase II [Deltaproteobacteria bacterium]|nr:MAG: signal peptidase II [Deltaproteobacteria bacterium]
MKRTWTIFGIVALVGVILDQATKIWIVSNLEYRVDSIDIIPGLFQLVHAQNPGAAFGFMRNMPVNARVALFLFFTVIAMGVILDMVRKLKDTDKFMPVVLGMIFSGAIGNAIDRIHKQTVTDFLRFYTDNPEWIATLRSYNLPPEYPSFNVADIALVVGVLMFVVHSFLEKDEAPESNGAPPEANGAEA